MPGQHALLSSSGSKIWLACTPSARLTEHFPEQQSVYAAEGSLAHNWSEALLKLATGEINKLKYQNMERKFKNELALHKGGDYEYDQKMLKICKDYVSFCVEQYNQALSEDEDSFYAIESKVDLSGFIPEGFGTADWVVISPSTLYLTDLKFGKGVAVSAEDNSQLMIYAYGLVKKYRKLYGFTKVVLTIYQPRTPGGINSWTTDVEYLTKWATLHVAPRAKAAFAGEGMFVAGDHCHFCKAAPRCKTLAAYSGDAVPEEFTSPHLLNDEQFIRAMERAPLAVKWFGMVLKYALEQATNEGKQYEGFKLVYGSSKRQVSDEKGLSKSLNEAGYDEDDYKPRKFLGIGDLESLLGSSFDSLASEYIIKPKGAPTLVPISDKREAIGSLARAEKTFAGFSEMEE